MGLYNLPIITSTIPTIVAKTSAVYVPLPETPPLANATMMSIITTIFITNFITSKCSVMKGAKGKLSVNILLKGRKICRYINNFIIIKKIFNYLNIKFNYFYKMDITLNNYLKRADDIINNITNVDKKRTHNEIICMISTIENTLILLKDKYKTFAMPKTKTSTLLQNVQSVSIYNNNVNTTTVHLVNETNQYKLQINDLILLGNIGNIYDKNILLNDRIQAHQVVCCKYGNTCKNILSEVYCKYYHEPQYLLVLKNKKLISSKFYEKTIKYIRNFSNTAWVYSSIYAPNTRCIGSKTSLLNDIQIAHISQKYKDNIENMKQQVMHDLLVLLTLSENNLA